MLSNAVYVRKRSIYYGLFFITALSTIGTLASYYFTHISPQDFWPGAFLSLGLPMLIGFNFVLIFCWLMVRPSLAIWPLGLIIAGAPFISAKPIELQLAGAVRKWVLERPLLLDWSKHKCIAHIQPCWHWHH